jgi:hypothetical protein
MGKYTDLSANIFSVFGSPEWSLEKIKTFPSDFTGKDAGTEYLRVTIIPSGHQAANTLTSVSGILMVEIFTAAGFGPNRALTIADKLDTYLAGKVFRLGEGQTQFASSTLAGGALDKANSSLYRDLYSIPFNHFGV